KPIFSNQDINDVFDNYDVMSFKKAYPFSDYENLRQIYVVHSNSISLAIDLKSTDSLLFPYYEGVKHVTLAGYTPVERILGNYSDSYLDLIGAEDAWAKSKGDTNIVIGVTDNYFDISHEDMQGKYDSVEYNALLPSD